jgi:hypothetical protein
MSISTEVRKAGPYTGNDSTTAFAFAFKVFDTGDVKVISTVTSTGAETVKTLTTDYTVSLNADQNGDPGGTVTMLTAPATGTTLTITSNIPNTQPVQLVNLSGFYPSVLNDGLDRATIQIQQLDVDNDRALKIPISSSASPELPAPEATKYLRWNSGGTALENADGGGGGSSVWSLTGSDAYYTAGNVGVGTASPSVTFDVAGNAKVSGDFTLNNVNLLTSTGAPEGAVNGPAGSLFLRSDASDGRLYVKTTGTGNTGWEQLAISDNLKTTLNSLNDVNAGSPTDGQVLAWSASGSEWVAATVGSGGSGATQLNELSDVTITSSATGHVLIHNGSVYVNRVLTTADIASGTFADARISSSSVVQHLPTVTLAGDATGSIDLSAATSLSVSVNDNSHNHIIGNVTGLQTALDAKAALAGATFTGAVVGTTIRAKPAHTSQSTAYTLDADDMNTTINTTGNVTIDGSVGTAGDIVIVCNNSASPISIVDGTITTMRLAGTTTTGTRTLAARGLAFIYYVSATEVSVGGSGVT